MDMNTMIFTAFLRILIFFGISVIIQIIIYFVKKTLAKNNKKHSFIYNVLSSIAFFPFLWINGISIYSTYTIFKMPFPNVSSGDKRKIVVILAVLTISYILIRIITKCISHTNKYEKGGIESTGVFVNSIKIITLIIIALIILNVLKIPITPIVTALGVGSALLALTLQETLSNFLSGFYMASSLQFKPGDFIKVKDSSIEGTVTDITWRYTIIRDTQNSYNTIPNSVLGKSTIVNYSQPNNEYFFGLYIKVSQKNNIEKITNIMNDVIQYTVENYQFCPKDYIPCAKISATGMNFVEFYVWFKVVGYTNQYTLRDLYYKTLVTEFQKNNIESPTFQYEIHKG